MSPVDQMVQDIDQRIGALRTELSQLEAARTALAGTSVKPAKTEAKPKTRRPGRPAGTNGVSRSDQALALVQSSPGITISDLAGRMKIEPNYLYRVMPKLMSEGKVKRDGQGWHPVS